MFIQTEYLLHYKVYYKKKKKKLVQKLSTSHGGLCYKSYLHRPPTSDKQSTKKVVRADSLEHSPWSHQASDGDLRVGEYPVDRTQLQKWLATTEAYELRPNRPPVPS